jgi:hypothetical protein
MTQP